MQIRRIISILPILMVCHIIPVTAETLVDGGAVDYNMGAEGLYSMTEFLLVMMHYVTLVLYAIATLTAIVNALQIYIKMNNQEGDISKSIMMIIGACVFLIAAAQALPLFFGIEDGVITGF